MAPFSLLLLPYLKRAILVQLNRYRSTNRLQTYSETLNSLFLNDF